MSSLAAPVTSDRDRGPRIMHLITQLLFWQGFLPEDPEHDLDVYIRNLNPRLAGFILRHRRLRLAISWYRTLHPWMIFAFLFVNSFILNPVAIYRHWNDTEILVENAAMMCLWLLALIAMTSIYFNRHTLNMLIIKIDELSKIVEIQDDEQNEMMKKSHVFCERVVKFLHLIAIPVVYVATLIYVVAVCVPTRQLMFRPWYPYDVTSTPGFEITLTINTLIQCQLFAAANALTSSLVSVFIYLRVYFDIIQAQLLNIRGTSIQKIKEMKKCLVLEQPVVASRNRGRRGKFNSRVLADRRRRLSQEQIHRHAEINDLREAPRTVIRIEENLSELLSQRQEHRYAEINDLLEAPRTVRIEENLSELFSQRQEHCHVEINALLEAPKTVVRIEENLSEMLSQRHSNRQIITQDLSVEVFNQRPINILKGRDNTEQILNTKTLHKDSVRVSETEEDVAIQVELAKLIICHVDIINIVKITNDLLRVAFVVMFVINVGVYAVTITMFKNITNLGEKGLIIMILSFKLVMVFLWLNIMANKITDQSAAVGEALYASDWIEASTSFKRLMLIVMTRANRPVEFKPPGLNPLSANNFGVVAHLAYKMCTRVVEITGNHRL